MAEFFDVMKQVGRMCASVSCNNCILPRWSDEMCIWQDAPAKLADEVIAEIEAKTLQWAAEHPEVRYPTWREWHSMNFPDVEGYITPCGFMPRQRVEALMGKGCGDLNCHQCVKLPIPADIAKKLGVKPVTKENDMTTKEASQ